MTDRLKQAMKKHNLSHKMATQACIEKFNQTPGVGQYPEGEARLRPRGERESEEDLWDRLPEAIEDDYLGEEEVEIAIQWHLMYYNLLPEPVNVAFGL